jgi:hypothetical protein
MGNDGGSVPKGGDLRKTKKADKKPDPVEKNRTRWLTCAISKNPLRAPIVTDHVGNLFNKESLIKALIEKTLPKHFDHIRSLKEVFEVHFNHNKAYIVTARADKVGDAFLSPYDCPITGRQVNGQYSFCALKTCGHIFSEKGLRETEAGATTFRCSTCGVPYSKTDIHVLNPSPELTEDIRARIKSAQKAARDAKKRNHDSMKGEKDEQPQEPKLKKHKGSESTSASTSTASLAVRVAMSKAEGNVDARKVSEAYKTIFTNKDDDRKSNYNFTGIYLK